MTINYKPRGVIYFLALIIFLGFAIFFPWTTLRGLALFFAGLLIVQGAFSTIEALVTLGKPGVSAWELIYGAISLILGFLILNNLSYSIEVISYMLLGWIFLSGAMLIITGISHRLMYEEEISLFSGGILIILLSAAALFIFPFFTVTTFAWVISIYLVIWIISVVAQAEIIEAKNVSASSKIGEKKKDER